MDTPSTPPENPDPDNKTELSSEKEERSTATTRKKKTTSLSISSSKKKQKLNKKEKKSKKSKKDKSRLGSTVSFSAGGEKRKRGKKDKGEKEKEPSRKGSGGGTVGGNAKEGGGKHGGGKAAPAADEHEYRRILINQPQPRKFISNKISSGKYTWYSYIFKFLFEQLRRYSNLFFILIICFQLLPDVSPTGKFTTLIPFVVILLVSAVKELIEDYKRHKADRVTNNRKASVFNRETGEFTKKAWLSITVGDFVQVHNDEPFPADLILISSSESTGIAYIETANLDGETNLKIRQAIPYTSNITGSKIKSQTGYVVCEEPNRFLYEFLGKISLEHGSGEGSNKETPLGPDQILLRGAKLQNTAWAIGLVIYTGHETKLMKNANTVPLKQSTVDKKTNTCIFFLFLFLLAIAVTCTVSSLEWEATQGNGVDLWYIPYNENDLTYRFIFSLLTFIILFNNLIPVSLTVTLELVRFFQAKFIGNDLDMYYAPSDIPAVAKTSNLNEELGLIRYIFSDKTGTLTQNVMEFRGCSIGGYFYSPDKIGEDQKSPLVVRMKQKHRTAADIRDFLTILAVCHTVIPDRSTGELVYHASSPDEAALVQGAKRYGFEFLSRTPATVTIQVDLPDEKTTEVYEILNTLEFTSDRKRMSVVVRTPDKKIRLFTKGADMMVYDRTSTDEKINSQETRERTQKHLDDFSKLGLRTLCLASKELTDSEYKHWNEEYQAAATSLKDHDKKVAEVGEKIETELRLVGATAIEDKLQDGVPEAIQSLLQAGISIWVLTGDKQETAINIGRSCNLVTSTMQLFIVNQATLHGTYMLVNKYLDQLHTVYGEQIPEDVNAAVVIDGKTLNFATNKKVKADFINLCTCCRVVVCCRASPFQKAEIVGEVTKKTGKQTLSIGDGANDVAMIQRAHVGVGIAGVEGLQAASNADYAFGQFKYLKKLLFVHGAWNYDRISKVILYCFYKNVFLYIVGLWYAANNGFSGQILFDKWTISLYNLVFTASQPLAVGLFEQNCMQEIRLSHPKLYIENQAGFSTKVFMVWIVESIIQSAVVFILTIEIYGEGIVWGAGLQGGLLVVGNYCYTYVIIVVSLKAGFQLRSWVAPSHVAIWGSIVTWFIFLPAFGALSTTSFLYPSTGDMVGIGAMIFTAPSFWLGIPVVVFVCFVPELCLNTLKNTIGSESEEEFWREEDVAMKDQDSGEKLVTDRESRILAKSTTVKHRKSNAHNTIPPTPAQHSQHPQNNETTADA